MLPAALRRPWHCVGRRPQELPKRIHFLFDLSASMSRYASDGRLQRSLEAAVMVMESFHSFPHKVRQHPPKAPALRALALRALALRALALRAPALCAPALRALALRTLPQKVSAGGSRR